LPEDDGAKSSLAEKPQKIRSQGESVS
jgi:hypothetical protein